MAVLSSSAYLTYRITPPSRVGGHRWLFRGTERNGTELKSKIRNGTGLTERSFLSCIAQTKSSRPLDYVHNAILEYVQLFTTVTTPKISLKI